MDIYITEINLTQNIVYFFFLNKENFEKNKPFLQTMTYLGSNENKNLIEKLQERYGEIELNFFGNKFDDILLYESENCKIKIHNVRYNFRKLNKKNHVPQIGYILRGNRNLASSRIQGLTILDKLKNDKDINLILLHMPEVKWENDLSDSRLAEILWSILLLDLNVCIFQKTSNKNHIQVMAFCKFLEIQTIYIECDLQRSWNFEKYIDHFVVPTKNMASVIELVVNRKSMVIRDCIDFELQISTDRQAFVKKSGNVFRGCWIAMGDKFPHFNMLREAIQNIDASIEIDAISNHPQADVKWESGLFPEILNRYQFAFITMEKSLDNCIKSENRVIFPMYHSLPVVCQRHAAYEDVIVNAENGFMYSTPKEACSQILQLKNKEVFSTIVSKGVETSQYYTAKNVSRVWKEFLLACSK